MKIKKTIGAFALSAVLAAGAATPAFAAPAGAAAQVPSVEKTLSVNAGSTVTATFQYTATPVELSTGNGAEKTYTDGPAAKVADITLTDASSTANNKATGAITFGGKTDASAFTHAGVYAWKIVEVKGADTVDGGTMQYDTQAYTLIATVVNKDGGFEFGSIVIVKGETASVTNANKLDPGAGNAIPFVNKYTETTTDGANNNLTITKKVAGNQGDKTKKFDFTVTFKAPTVLPAGKDAAAVLDAIQVANNGATDVVKNPAAGDTMTVTFKAADANAVTFKNVLVGTTYSVTEAAADGYTQAYAAVANGENKNVQTDLLVGEKTNTGTMTNTYNDITPTGLLLSSAPFILLGAVAIGGVVLYGALKRRLTA